MKIVNKNNRKINLFISLGIILIVGALGAYYYMHHFQVGIFQPPHPVTNENSSKVNSINYNSPTSEQIKTGNDIKTQSANNNQTTTETPQAVTMEITSTTQNGSTYNIRTIIDTLSTAGSCSLQMTGPNGVSYTAQANVQAMASSTTCEGFNVPISSLSSGAWTITIDFSDGTKSASATKNVTIQ